MAHTFIAVVKGMVLDQREGKRGGFSASVG